MIDLTGEETMTLYKSVTANGAGPYSGFAWPLPTESKPGNWVKIEGELVACENGLHVARGELELLQWLDARVFRVEVAGAKVEAHDKLVVRRARLIEETAWSETTARLFAADCAERVLHIFERRHPNDGRPRDAITAARAFARGEISGEQRSAARAVAEVAAWEVTEAAARSASWAASRAAARANTWAAAPAATEATAGDDARFGAWNAARAAAWNVARDVEKAWQAERLRQYLTGEAPVLRVA